MNNFQIIQKSVKYIESNLYTILNPPELCKQYEMSEFNFYLLFKHVIGVSVMEYISKRRTSDQLYRWASSNKKLPLAEVAKYAHFSSHRALLKLVKREFHITPRQYHQMFDGTELYPPFNIHKYKSLSDDVFDKTCEVVTIPSATLIGLSTITHLSKQQHVKDIADLKNKIDLNYDNIEHLSPLGCHKVGLVYNTHIDLKNNDNISFEYFRGYHVSKISKLPSDFRVLSVPKLHCLRFKTTTNPLVFDQTLNYIYSDYLINNPVKLKDSSINMIECYQHEKVDGDDILIELYIPIEKK